MPKKKKDEEMAYTEQRFYPNPMEELGKTNAIPRDTEFDLEPCPSRTHFLRCDEQTFKVVRRGNRPSIDRYDRNVGGKE